MFTCLAKPFLLLCILVQSVQVPLSFASPPQQGPVTVTVDGHEITEADVILAGAAAGQIVLDRSMNGILRAYFVISDSEFEKATAKLLPKHAEKVLYIRSFRKDDNFYRISKARFKKQYGKHPNAVELEVTSPKEMISKLKALPQNSSFDRIELEMHGNGGVLEFADGTQMTRHDHPWFSEGSRYFDVEELNRAGLKIAAAGADLRISACAVADPLNSDRPIGKDFLKDVGKSLMSKGGRVFATEKAMLVLPIQTEIALKMPILGLLSRAILLGESIVTTKLPKDHSFRKDVVQVDVPPREQSCAPVVIWSLQNILRGK